MSPINVSNMLLFVFVAFLALATADHLAMQYGFWGAASSVLAGCVALLVYFYLQKPPAARSQS